MFSFRSSFALLAATFFAVVTNSHAAVSIGSVNLPAGSTTSVTVSISSAISLGSISVVTQGVSGADFNDAGGGTCSVGSSYPAGSTCTVMVHFAPTYPGPRYGAVLLKDSTSDANVFATVYLQGTSQAPQIGLVNATLLDLGGVPVYPYSEDVETYAYSSYGGLAFDPTGAFYLASQSNGAFKGTPQSNGSYVLTNLDINLGAITGPGIAIDGSGNLYIACGTSICKETPAASGTYSLSTVASGFISIFGLAVDGAGNLYVVDNPSYNGIYVYPTGSGILYKESLQADGSYLQSVIDSTLVGSGAVTVDLAGNIFVTDGTIALFKETPSGSTYTRTTIDSSLFEPVSLALNSNGDIFSADTANYINIFNPRKCTVAAQGTPALVEEALQPDGSYQSSQSHRYASPNVIGFDGAGNKFVVDSFSTCYSQSGELYKTLVDDPNPPVADFGSVLHGTTTAAQTIPFTNYGNAPLNFSAITFPTHFPKAPAAAGDCAVGTALAPGASCNVSFVFKATAPLNGAQTIPFSETITLSSDSFKRSQQTIEVDGIELSNTNAAPVFSLAAGTYPAAQTLTITEATAGASVYYTTDGSTPSSSSAKYTGPINVSSTETVTAIAILAGNIDSSLTSAHYLIQQPAATPVFSIAAGTYNNQQNVTITDSSPGVVIYYTINGGTPTTASYKYTGPVAIRSTETLRANAVGLPNYYTGPTASATYTLAVAAPVLTPAAGTYSGPRTVTITDATTVAHIYYTTNGSTPTGYSTPYTGPIAVSASETIKVIAISTGYTASPVTTAAYTILGPPAIPTFSVPTGTYNNQQNVTITDSVPGATIYYTLNGTTPTTASPRYTAPVAVRNTSTLRAIAVTSGYPPSAVGSATYTLLAAPPVLTPAGGTYTGARTVTITDASATAHLYYTTNGSNPSGYSTPYTGPITVSASETIKAIAIATGYTPSPVVTNTYTIH